MENETPEQYLLRLIVFRLSDIVQQLGLLHGSIERLPKVLPPQPETDDDQPLPEIAYTPDDPTPVQRTVYLFSAEDYLTKPFGPYWASEPLPQSFSIDFAQIKS